MQWRETGSIRLDAPRDRVFEVLARWMETEKDVRVKSADRFETADAQARVSTFILRPEGEGTRVIHARTAPMALGRTRNELREQVAEELQRVSRLVQAYGRP